MERRKSRVKAIKQGMERKEKKGTLKAAQQNRARLNQLSQASPRKRPGGGGYHALCSRHECNKYFSLFLFLCISEYQNVRRGGAIGFEKTKARAKERERDDYPLTDDLRSFLLLAEINCILPAKTKVWAELNDWRRLHNKREWHFQKISNSRKKRKASITRRLTAPF